MILARDLSQPDAHELRACALWALAESTVVYPPVGLFLVAVRPFGLGAQMFAIPFVVGYVGGAALAYRFRTSRNLGTAAAMVAVLVGLLVGRDGFAEAAVAALVALLVALRVVTLAVRDWRSPIHAELVWGAAALGTEAMLAAALPEWRALLAAFVPTFFGAALASRAVTVWSVGSPGELDERLGSSWIRRTLLAAGGLAAAMALAVVLGVRGGLFDVLGRLVRPVAEVVGSAVLWLILQAARPLFWLADRFGIDPERVREFLDRLRQSVAGARGPVDVRPPEPRALGAGPRPPDLRRARLRALPGPASRPRRATGRGRAPAASRPGAERAAHRRAAPAGATPLPSRAPGRCRPALVRRDPPRAAPVRALARRRRSPRPSSSPRSPPGSRTAPRTSGR